MNRTSLNLTPGKHEQCYAGFLLYVKVKIARFKQEILFLTGCLLLAMISFQAFSQLPGWNNKPQKGFVFQISNKEAQKLLTDRDNDSLFLKMLHTQVDTFNVSKGWTNKPSKGHFILVKIVGNNLYCEYSGILPYQVFLMKEYDALALQVMDVDGNVRTDAKVKINWRRIPLDSESKTYRLENDYFYGNHRSVSVDCEGFRSIFNVDKHEVPTWMPNYNYDQGPTFYSYLITDKNKYKPGEKVRFKSYALSSRKIPLKKELEIWLYGNNKSVKIGKIAPHRPGSYAGEFTLHDSLKLSLDKDYSISLRDKEYRYVSTCYFRLEDYELFGNKLQIELSNSPHHFPEENTLRIKATDVNGLMLKDAKARVIVRLLTIHETFQPMVSLSDTLMVKDLKLDSEVPTRVSIPVTLFEKSNLDYEVRVQVLNSENQRMESSLACNYNYSSKQLETTFSGDSICYSYKINGKLVPNCTFDLMHDGDKTPRMITLPFREKLNPIWGYISLRNDSVSRVFSTSLIYPTLELQGGIKADSFNVRLFNPQQLDASWFVYQGSTLLKKGFGKEIEFHSRIENRSENYYVEMVYTFGKQEHLLRRSFEFKEANLNVDFEVPDRVYPGQSVEATIRVKDDSGIPQKGVDLLAMGVTSKLNYYLPDLPYYGSNSSPRPQKATYSKSDIFKREAILPLNYEKWKKVAGLDTMRYYIFTYPSNKEYKYSYPISDSTQFAPFVMENGNAVNIYAIEINHVPVYYSFTNQPKKYSFYVPNGKKCVVSLRLFDREIELDSVMFTPGHKTLWSIDLNHLPWKTITYLLPHSFTQTEISRYNATTAIFTQTPFVAYLEQKKAFVPLWNDVNRRYNLLRVGPLKEDRTTYVECVGLKTSYRHSGNYQYLFEENIVYKKDDNSHWLEYMKLYRSYQDPWPLLNDTVLTKTQFLAPKSSKNTWITRNIQLDNANIRFRIKLPHDTAASGISSVLFINPKDQQVLAPCSSRTTLNGSDIALPSGFQHLVVLYNNGTYFRYDSIPIRNHHSMVLDFNHMNLHPADVQSKQWVSLYSDWLWNCHATSDPYPTPVRQFNYRYTNSGNVRGTVLDAATNEPLIGTNVVIAGTTEGTVCDMDGRFSLQVNSDEAKLMVSFIGYATKEVIVRPGSDLFITLEPDIQKLEEVVVIGYGIMRSSNLSGSVAGVSVSDKSPVPRNEENEVNEQGKDAGKKDAGEQKLYQELLTIHSIRSKFSDVGFWEPRLFTDKHGEAKFRITFPDDITQWDALIYAMNRNAETGTARKYIKSYKPLMAELALPQFLTRGDSALVVGKVLNYTSDSLIHGSYNWKWNNRQAEKGIQFHDAFVDKFLVSPLNTDSVKALFKFTRHDGYLDGEERTIPVNEQGTIRANGTLNLLVNDETITVKANPQQKSTIELMDNQLDLYTGEVNYLVNYRFLCNEQLASRLVGLINDQLLNRYNGKKSEHEREINKIIQKLLKNQNQEFLWSWWDVSPYTSYWMSAHILRALKFAQDAGYMVNLDIANLSRKAGYRFEFLNELSICDIDLINALASWKVALPFQKYIQDLDSLLYKEEHLLKKENEYRPRWSLLNEKFLIEETRLLVGLPYHRDTLLHYLKKNILGFVNFSDERSSRYWYYDEKSANLTAYRMIKKDSILKDLLFPMQMYFVYQRKKHPWNTYESASVLMTVLSDLMKTANAPLNKAVVELTGSTNAQIKKFPYKTELEEGQSLTIQKTSGLPIFCMQYVRERVTQAKTGLKGFSISSHFNNQTDILEAGKPVDLYVDVEVENDASTEHVMIEVPIPGSCSYASKQASDHYQETHREYFKDKTYIFCENLKAGKYRFSIHLLPRFTGSYLLNPASVSLMYFPVINANNDMRRIWVKEN